MMHINDGCLLQFYVHMTLTSPDTIWIMFKKKRVLFIFIKSWSDTIRNNHTNPSQSICCGYSTLFYFELEWICKTKTIMPRMMKLFYNWLRPDFIWLMSSLWLSMLFDLDYVTPSNQNPWQFLVNTVMHVSFWVYRNSLPIFDYNRMDLMHKFATAVTYMLCSTISIIVMLWHIISCIRFCSIMVVLITITSYLIHCLILLIRNRPVKVWPCFMVTENRAFFTLFRLHSFQYGLIWIIISIESLVTHFWGLLRDESIWFYLIVIWSCMLFWLATESDDSVAKSVQSIFYCFFYEISS